MICPSVEENIILKGTEQSMQASALMFQINRCVNDSLNSTFMEGKKCKSPEEIDEFIKRVQVETWTNYYKIDFTIHPARTARRIEKFQKYNLLHPTYVIGNMYTIRRNDVQTEDGLVQFGQTSWDWSYYDLDHQEYKPMEYYPNKKQPDAVYENIFHLGQTARMH